MGSLSSPCQSGGLKGAPYIQSLPYICKGVYHLNDYDEMLQTLDNAFGDPNRRFNARSQIYQLRQNNKDFSIYFAEFQRLALEGEMVEAALPRFAGKRHQHGITRNVDAQ